MNAKYIMSINSGFTTFTDFAFWNYFQLGTRDPLLASIIRRPHVKFVEMLAHRMKLRSQSVG